MKIRKATKIDVKQLLELWKDYSSEHTKIEERDKRARGLERLNSKVIQEMKKYFEENIESAKGEVFVVEKDEKIVAFELILIKPDAPIYQSKKIGYINDLYVKKGYRKKGLAIKLFKQAIKWFKQKKIKHISLQVNKNNHAAHSMYQKQGFFDYMISMRRKLK